MIRNALVAAGIIILSALAVRFWVIDASGALQLRRATRATTTRGYVTNITLDEGSNAGLLRSRRQSSIVLITRLRDGYRPWLALTTQSAVVQSVYRHRDIYIQYPRGYPEFDSTLLVRDTLTLNFDPAANTVWATGSAVYDCSDGRVFVAYLSDGPAHVLRQHHVAAPALTMDEKQAITIEPRASQP